VEGNGLRSADRVSLVSPWLVLCWSFSRLSLLAMNGPGAGAQERAVVYTAKRRSERPQDRVHTYSTYAAFFGGSGGGGGFRSAGRPPLLKQGVARAHVGVSFPSSFDFPGAELQERIIKDTLKLHIFELFE